VGPVVASGNGRAVAAIHWVLALSGGSTGASYEVEDSKVRGGE
jgi:hypothetical protein